VNIVKSVRSAVEAGNIVLGSKQSIEKVISGEAKLVVVSATCERGALEDLERYARLSGIEVQRFEGSGVELGEVCGKPFAVSMLAVLEPEGKE